MIVLLLLCTMRCLFAADIPEDQFQYCGAALCEDEFIQSGNSTRPAQHLVNTLLGCYIGKNRVFCSKLKLMETFL